MPRMVLGVLVAVTIVIVVVVVVGGIVFHNVACQGMGGGFQGRHGGGVLVAVVLAVAVLGGGPLGVGAAALLGVLALRVPALPWAPSARRTTWSTGDVR